MATVSASRLKPAAAPVVAHDVFVMAAKKAGALPSPKGSTTIFSRIEQNPALLGTAEYLYLAEWICRMEPHARTAVAGSKAAASAAPAPSPSAAAPLTEKKGAQTADNVKRSAASGATTAASGGPPTTRRKSMLPAPPSRRKSLAASAALASPAPEPEEHPASPPPKDVAALAPPPTAAAAPSSSAASQVDEAAATLLHKQSSQDFAAFARRLSEAPPPMGAEAISGSPLVASPVPRFAGEPVVFDDLDDEAPGEAPQEQDEASATSAAVAVAVAAATDAAAVATAAASRAIAAVDRTPTLDTPPLDTPPAAPPSAAAPTATAGAGGRVSSIYRGSFGRVASGRSNRSSISTPTLEGSPPRSIGKALLSSSRKAYGSRVYAPIEGTPELHDAYSRHDVDLTPELAGSPKSLKKPTTGGVRAGGRRTAGSAVGAKSGGGAGGGRASMAAGGGPGGGGAAATAGGAASSADARRTTMHLGFDSPTLDGDGDGVCGVEDDFLGGMGMGFHDAAAAAAAPGLSSGAERIAVPSLEPVWTVAAASPAAGRQLRQTPVRRTRDLDLKSPYAKSGGGGGALSAARSYAAMASARREKVLEAALRSREKRSEARGAAFDITDGGTADDDVDASRTRLAFETAAAIVGNAATQAAPRLPDAVAAAAAPPLLAAEPAASPAPVPASEPQPAAADAAPRELDLAAFPSTFQRAPACTQLRMLHAALRDATTPPTAHELVGGLLPEEGKFEWKRCALLLEVMLSRRTVTFEGHGSDRRWKLAP